MLGPTVIMCVCAIQCFCYVFMYKKALNVHVFKILIIKGSFLFKLKIKKKEQTDQACLSCYESSYLKF